MIRIYIYIYVHSRLELEGNPSELTKNTGRPCFRPDVSPHRYTKSGPRRWLLGSSVGQGAIYDPSVRQE